VRSERIALVGSANGREPRVPDSLRGSPNACSNPHLLPAADRTWVASASNSSRLGSPSEKPARAHLPTATQYTDGRLAPSSLSRVGTAVQWICKVEILSLSHMFHRSVPGRWQLARSDFNSRIAHSLRSSPFSVASEARFRVACFRLSWRIAFCGRVVELNHAVREARGNCRHAGRRTPSWTTAPSKSSLPPQKRSAAGQRPTRPGSTRGRRCAYHRPIESIPE
jgi:hypothetical protein